MSPLYSKLFAIARMKVLLLFPLLCSLHSVHRLLKNPLEMDFLSDKIDKAVFRLIQVEPNLLLPYSQEAGC
jgi:hypothetical protein